MKKIIIISLSLIMALLTASAGYSEENTYKEKNYSSPFSQVKFIPDIAFIVDMGGVYRSVGDSVYKKLGIPGYKESTITGEENQADFNKNTGFNFNYGELSLYAAVDPYFELFGILHLSTEGIEIEEAYVNTTSLPGGFGLKIGKFKSGFGRLNEKHQHQWNFYDRPLVFQALFGKEGIDEIGAQATWVAPTDIYLKIGAEVLQGENGFAFGTEGFHDPTYMYKVKGTKGPNLYTGFIKSSFDVGDLTVLYGVSALYGITRIFHNIADTSLEDFYCRDYGSLAYGIRARTGAGGADITLKYQIDSYRYVTLQSEYIIRQMRGRYYYTSSTPQTYRLPLSKLQSGMYAELVVKPFLRWRFGARFGLLNINKVVIGSIDMTEPYNLYKISCMTDFAPSEFSLFRLQYNYDRSGYNTWNHRRANHEVVVEANIAIGAHGAHSF